MTRKPADHTTDEPLSKTAAKRAATELQMLGQRLAELNDDRLAGFELPAALHTALVDYRRFPTREAKRRQLQFIGKLMRKIDVDAIRERFADLDGQSAAARYRFHQVEQWRDRFLGSAEHPPEDRNKVLNAYLETHPGADRQRLRHLLKRADAAVDPAARKAASRSLFRYLKETDDEQP